MDERAPAQKSGKPLTLRKILKGVYLFFGLMVLFGAALVFLGMVFYIIKSLLRIDIFPGFHFWEWL
jgi:hypothetical protein